MRQFNFKSAMVLMFVVAIICTFFNIAIAGVGTAKSYQEGITLGPTGLTIKYDAQAYARVTQANGGGVIFNSFSDGAPGFAFLDPVTITGTLGVTGELTGAGPKHYVSVPLSSTANATVVTGVFAVQRAMTVTKASICYVAKPASAGGAVTLALTNYDASAAAEDNLLSTATVDLEGLTNFTVSDLTLTATAADLVLSGGDYIYASIVSDNADMTGASGGGTYYRVYSPVSRLS